MSSHGEGIKQQKPLPLKTEFIHKVLLMLFAVLGIWKVAWPIGLGRWMFSRSPALRLTFFSPLTGLS